ncbi:hypothetical protein GCM10014715_04340 [Streptomyces spiralis]|uniref:Uncharacterized protein n=1 Tax=Streptomyces spiralis TaxID=66376 RepID=A0A919DLJ1_9ACTN|nr:hypothetical protein GCM10014715_04340 [Streptomyces spiralis]
MTPWAGRHGVGGPLETGDVRTGQVVGRGAVALGGLMADAVHLPHEARRLRHPAATTPYGGVPAPIPAHRPQSLPRSQPCRVLDIRRDFRAEVERKDAVGEHSGGRPEQLHPGHDE